MPVPNLAADIGKQDWVNLRNHNWPWADSVDSASQTFGTDKCGQKTYWVTDDQLNPVPYVEFRADGTLIMSPVDGRDPVGQHLCILHA